MTGGAFGSPLIDPAVAHPQRSDRAAFRARLCQVRLFARLGAENGPAFLANDGGNLLELFQQTFGDVHDRIERRSELVRDRGQKITLRSRSSLGILERAAQLTYVAGELPIENLQIVPH